MTEEEAMTKTCWLTLVPVAAGEGLDPTFSLETCIGSKCMAWRWSGVLHEGKRIYAPQALFAAQNPDLPSGKGGMNSDDKPLGYCGKVGKPEIGWK